MSESRYEAHELKHHDQGSGCGLRHAKAVKHFSRFQPAIVLNRLLGDISQHGVGSAEGHHRHLGEEDGDLAEHVAEDQEETRSTTTGISQSDKPNRCDARPCAQSSVGYGPDSHHQAGYPHRGPFCRASCPLRNGEGGSPGPLPKKPDKRRRENDQRKRDAKKKIATNAAAASAITCAALERSLADPNNGFDDDRQYGRLQPEEQRRDNRHLPQSA